MSHSSSILKMNARQRRWGGAASSRIQKVIHSVVCGRQFLVDLRLGDADIEHQMLCRGCTGAAQVIEEELERDAADLAGMEGKLVPCRLPMARERALIVDLAAALLERNQGAVSAARGQAPAD